MEDWRNVTVDRMSLVKLVDDSKKFLGETVAVKLCNIFGQTSRICSFLSILVRVKLSTSQNACVQDFEQPTVVQTNMLMGGIILDVPR